MHPPPPDDLPVAVLGPPCLFLIGCAFLPEIAAAFFALALLLRSAPHTLTALVLWLLPSLLRSDEED